MEDRKRQRGEEDRENMRDNKVNLVNEREVEGLENRERGEALWGWSNSENASHCPPSLLSLSLLLLLVEIHPFSLSSGHLCGGPRENGTCSVVEVLRSDSSNLPSLVAGCSGPSGGCVPAVASSCSGGDFSSENDVILSTLNQHFHTVFSAPLSDC